MAAAGTKRPREDCTIKVMCVMDPTTYNGEVLQKCFDEHTKATGGWVTYVSGNDIATLKAEAEGVDIALHAVFAGGNAGLIGEVWSSMPKVEWVHSLSAGVDALCPVLRDCPGAEAMPVSNAKG